jgi:hypothetical protein
MVIRSPLGNPARYARGLRFYPSRILLRIGLLPRNYCGHGHLDGAITDLSEGLLIQPENTDFLFHRRRWRLETGEFTEAERDFSLLLELERTSGSCWYTDSGHFLRAIASMKLGQHSNARDDVIMLPDDFRLRALGRLYTKEEVLGTISD